MSGAADHAGARGIVEAVDRVCRTNTALQVQLALALGPARLSYPRWRVLRTVVESDGPPSLQRIADRASLHRTSVRSLVSALEAAGYVRVELSTVDRRNVEVHVTKSGLAAFERGATAIGAMDVALVVTHRATKR